MNINSEKLKELKEAVSHLYWILDELDFELESYDGDLQTLAAQLDDLEIYLKEMDFEES